MCVLGVCKCWWLWFRLMFLVFDWWFVLELFGLVLLMIVIFNWVGSEEKDVIELVVLCVVCCICFLILKKCKVVLWVSCLLLCCFVRISICNLELLVLCCILFFCEGEFVIRCMKIECFLIEWLIWICCYLVVKCDLVIYGVDGVFFFILVFFLRSDDCVDINWFFCLVYLLFVISVYLFVIIGLLLLVIRLMYFFDCNNNFLWVLVVVSLFWFRNMIVLVLWNVLIWCFMRIMVICLCNFSSVFIIWFCDFWFKVEVGLLSKRILGL